MDVTHYPSQGVTSPCRENKGGLHQGTLKIREKESIIGFCFGGGGDSL